MYQRIMKLFKIIIDVKAGNKASQYFHVSEGFRQEYSMAVILKMYRNEALNSLKSYCPSMGILITDNVLFRESQVYIIIR